MSCGVGRRNGSDPPLLWLWCRPEATAPIRPLAGELPYATGVALEKTKKKKKKEEEEEMKIEITLRFFSLSRKEKTSISYCR